MRTASLLIDKELTPSQMFGAGTKNIRAIYKQQANQGVYKIPNAKSITSLFKDAKPSNLLLDGIEGQFARNGFDLWDFTINLPMSGLFYPESVGIRFGGGIVETVNAYKLNYTLAQGRLAGDRTTDSGTVGIKPDQLRVTTYPFQYSANVGYYEAMKTAHINYDVFGEKVRIVQHSWQVEIEHFVFQGNLGVNDITEASPLFEGGLYNQPTTSVTYKERLATETDWYEIEDMNTWVEILLDLVEENKANMAYDERGFVDTMHVPNRLYNAWQKAFIITGTTSLPVPMLTYLRQVLSDAIGREFRIRAIPYLDHTKANKTTANIQAYGKNGTDRIVMYRNDERTMRIHIPLPLTAGTIFPERNGWFQNHLGLISSLLVIYPAIVYYDNKAE